VEATVGYCKAAVAEICDSYGGDPSAVLLAGFSRGAIACNFIGLHDDEIAALWKAFIAHSHYDGVRPWPYAGSDRRSAFQRLERLHNRAQFISHEGSVQETKAYLQGVEAEGAFTFQALPYRNHTDTWVLRDIPERKTLRVWAQNVLNRPDQE
jgi:acetyl esterase/lipase